VISDQNPKIAGGSVNTGPHKGSGLNPVPDFTETRKRKCQKLS
jgi:hypothetical protein